MNNSIICYMERIITDRHLSGRNIFDVIRRARPAIRPSALYKAFGQRDIKVNGKRVGKDFRPQEGDVILVYVRDEESSTLPVPDVRMIYEDDNILIVFKPSGMTVVPLSDQINELSLTEYLGSEYGHIRLCHRLDRNTEGLVIAARNDLSFEEIKRLLNGNCIGKYYTALVHGKIVKESDLLEAYLFKDSRKCVARVSSEWKKGSRKICMIYSLLGYRGENSLLEIRILTGRTHQIRAHLAFIGHPVIGDGKYGINRENRKLKAKNQLLCASRLVFTIPEDSFLHYLDGTDICVTPSFIY